MGQCVPSSLCLRIPLSLNTLRLSAQEPPDLGVLLVLPGENWLAKSATYSSREGNSPEERDPGGKSVFTHGLFVCPR